MLLSYYEGPILSSLLLPRSIHHRKQVLTMLVTINAPRYVQWWCVLQDMEDPDVVLDMLAAGICQVIAVPAQRGYGIIISNCS